MNAATLLNWYYLIFLLPAGVAVILLLLSTVMSFGDGGTEADADADVDADMDADADADGENESESGGLGGVLSLIGVGHAPLTLVLGSLLLGWGFTGFWAVRLLSMTFAAPAAFIGPAILIAAVCAVLISRSVARVSAYIVPKIQTAAVSRESLVGREASVVYPISPTGGRAFYYDNNAVLHDVTCRVRPGQPEIGKGRKVILGAYDEASGRFYAEPSPFDEG